MQKYSLSDDNERKNMIIREQLENILSLVKKVEHKWSENRLLTEKKYEITKRRVYSEDMSLIKDIKYKNFMIQKQDQTICYLCELMDRLSFVNKNLDNELNYMWCGHLNPNAISFDNENEKKNISR